jgi:hypothetical protein
MALSMFAGAPRLVIPLTRAAARNERMRRVLGSESPKREPLERRPSRRALEFHAPLCDRYANFDIVQFFIWRSAFIDRPGGEVPLSGGEQIGESSASKMTFF